MSSYRSRSRLIAGVVLVVLLASVLGACAPKEEEITKVVIYTAKENEEIEEFIPVAEKAMPDLELEVLRLSTGDLTARLLAEKDNPQADLIWGTAATSMIIFKNEGMLEPYAPEGLDAILPTFRDPDDPPYWVGVDAYLTAFCYNTEVACVPPRATARMCRPRPIARNGRLASSAARISASSNRSRRRSGSSDASSRCWSYRVESMSRPPLNTRPSNASM